jgi:hypothetical protein
VGERLGGGGVGTLVMGRLTSFLIGWRGWASRSTGLGFSTGGGVSVATSSITMGVSGCKVNTQNVEIRHLQNTVKPVNSTGPWVGQKKAVLFARCVSEFQV